MAHELARRVGFSESGARAIRTSVEEGCNYVFSRAFDPEEQAQVRLILELESLGLRIKIQDHGLPLDTEALEKHLEEGSTLPRHLGVRLLRASADEVSFRHLGRGGNEISMFKQLKGQLPASFFRKLEREDSPVTTDRVKVRRAKPSEALGISRCIYRSYGYSYTGEENAYSPEWLSQMTREQAMFSAVAVAGAEIVGHVALVRRSAGIYELSQAAVDPGYRSRGLLKRMMSFLLDQAQRLEVRVVCADPVTHHTRSQRSTAGFGFTEVGLLLASVGDRVQVRGEPDLKERLSLMPSLKVMGRWGDRRFQLPEVYREIILRTLDRVGWEPPDPEYLPPKQKKGTRLSWGVHSLTEKGFVKVQNLGADAGPQLEKAFRHLLAERVVAIHLDLSLDSAYLDRACRIARQLGFFYGALLPGNEGKPLLRLQYLNQQQVDVETIQTVTEWGGELRAFVLGDRQAVLRLR